MSAQKPEALQLAELLEQGLHLFLVERKNAAAELRRLHAEKEVMLKALNDIAAWHDGEVGGHMDEPGSAKVAREAIQSISGDKA